MLHRKQILGLNHVAADFEAELPHKEVPNGKLVWDTDEPPEQAPRIAERSCTG